MISSLLAIVPYILMYNIIVELFNNTVDYSKIKSMAIFVGVVVVLRMVIFLLSGVFSHVAAFTILYELRMKAINHISKLHMGFFTGHTIGEMKKTINEDIEKLENFIAHQIPDLASAAITPIVIIGYLLYLKWQLALVLFIPIIIGFLSQMAMFRGLKKMMERYHVLVQKLNATIIQYINGINVMKAFNLTAKSFKNYKDTTEEYANFWIEITMKTAPMYAIFLVLIDSGLLFIIPIGGIMFLNGSINASTYILFLILSANFLTAFKQLLEFGETFSMLLEGAGKVRAILEQEVQKEGSKSLNKEIKGKIEFNNVSFKYDKNEVIKNIKPDSLLKNISMVFQDVYLLNDTIYNNIKLGNQNAAREEVIEAAKIANCHEFIEKLENKYDTVVSEGGSTLSGGEKQRISIARAILKDAPIILLDEATASLDADNEVEIRKAIRKLTLNKTVLVIAHRLNTIKDADQIIVLNNGEIEEKGTHYQLINNKKRYYNMYSEMEQAQKWAI